MQLTEFSSSRTQRHKRNKFAALNRTRFHRTNQPETCHTRYDANGSQTSVTSPTGTTTNIYDLQGHLASVTNKNTSGVVTSSATYIYDDQGNPDPRISPAEIGTGLLEEATATGSGAPVTTYFLVDTQTATGYSQVIEQSQTPGTPTVTYVWGLNLISQNNSAGTPNAGTYYFVVDGHGSTVALLNANGNVVQAFHYDSFGNALGFTPSSAITPYLYTQQYYDQFSSTYYDWARNYNPITGEFTQADYGNYGSLADPMSGLPYSFTGGDPINLSDLNGHDFSIAEVAIDMAINSIMTSAISGVVAPFASQAAALLIPPALLAALATAGSPDAVEFGLDATAGGQFKGFGGFATGGIELLASPKTGNAALYSYWGGGGSFSLGGGAGVSGGIAGSLGLVWRTPSSRDYAGRAVEISVPFGALPEATRANIERDLAESTASSNFLTEAETKLLASAGWNSNMIDDYQWQAMKDALARSGWLLSRLDSLSVNIFSPWPIDGSGLGISFSLDIAGGSTAGVTNDLFSLGFTSYTQIAPQQPVTFA